jgi:hypothetical protein
VLTLLNTSGNYWTNRDSINAESVCALWHAVAGADVGLPSTLVLDDAREHLPKGVSRD